MSQVLSVSALMRSVSGMVAAARLVPVRTTTVTVPSSCGWMPTSRGEGAGSRIARIGLVAGVVAGVAQDLVGVHVLEVGVLVAPHGWAGQFADRLGDQLGHEALDVALDAGVDVF